MEKQKVKGTATKTEPLSEGGSRSLITFQYGKSHEAFWWPYLLPVGAEVEVTVKVK